MFSNEGEITESVRECRITKLLSFSLLAIAVPKSGPQSGPGAFQRQCILDVLALQHLDMGSSD